jgi:hypothetical protein
VGHFWPLPLPAAAVDVLLERHFRAIVEGLLEQTAAEGAPPADVARALARQNLARLTADSRTAVRHELLIARFGRSRVRRILPPALVTALVGRVARTLGPRRRAIE